MPLLSRGNVGLRLGKDTLALRALADVRSELYRLRADVYSLAPRLFSAIPKLLRSNVVLAHWVADGRGRNISAPVGLEYSGRTSRAAQLGKPMSHFKRCVGLCLTRARVTVELTAPAVRAQEVGRL